MQIELFGSESERGHTRLPLVDAEVDYFPDFIPQPLAGSLFTSLREHIAWRSDDIKLYGKWHKIPRLQAWYGEPEATYQYSNLNMQPLPWTTELQQIRILCEQQCQHPFNAVLANLYRNGDDSMGWHADDEAELGARPIIASISLGETRNFDFKHKTLGERYRLPLTHGSLLVMSGSTQQFWQHGIAKTRIALGERINLTFRYIFKQKN